MGKYVTFAGVSWLRQKGCCFWWEEMAMGTRRSRCQPPELCQTAVADWDDHEEPSVPWWMFFEPEFGLYVMLPREIKLRIWEMFFGRAPIDMMMHF